MGVPEAFLSYAWEGTDLNAYAPDVRRQVREARKSAVPVALCGPTNSGKTRLAVAQLLRLLRAWPHAHVRLAPDGPAEPVWENPGRFRFLDTQVWAMAFASAGKDRLSLWEDLVAPGTRAVLLDEWGRQAPGQDGLVLMLMRQLLDRRVAVLLTTPLSAAALRERIGDEAVWRRLTGQETAMIELRA